MKKLLVYCIASLLTMPILGACDDIAEDDRYIDMDTVLPERAVLIEDFTGQNCSNCPDAHAVIELLEQQYGAAVIPVSIHAGSFGVSVDRTSYPDDYVGLMQPEGNVYNYRYDIKSWPAGMVNRRGGAMEHDKWAAAVRTELSTPAQANIEVEARLVDGKILIDTEISPKADIDANLQLWVVEDGIKAFQRNGRNRVPDYIHNNVFRAAVNGTWGEPAKLQKGIHLTLSHSIAVRNSATEVWDTDRLKVVAFIYNGTEVMQAAVTKVTKE